MSRVLGMVGIAAALAGCQAQNPYSAFGPNRVPPPGMQSPAPYYPAGATAAPAAAPASAGAATTGRLSVSAKSSAPSSPIASRAQTSGEDAIRIVENPAPAARTAAAGGTRSAGAAPAAAAPSSSPPAVPTREKSSSIDRKDVEVAQAAYETAAAPGQWKSR